MPHEMRLVRTTGRFCTSLGKKAKWCAHVMRQGGLSGAATDGLPMGRPRGRGCPKLRSMDNVTKWSSRSAGELRRTVFEGDGGDSKSAPPLQYEDEAATDVCLCRMVMMNSH